MDAPGATRKGLRLTLREVTRDDDGRLRVDLRANVRSNLGMRVSHVAIGTRRRFRTWRWIAATPSTRDLEVGDTPFTAVANRAESARYDYAAVRLVTTSRVEVVPSERVVEPLFLIVSLGLSTAIFWLVEGPMAAMIVLCCGSIYGEFAARASSRPAVRRFDPRGLIAYWPVAALLAAGFVFAVGGGRSDLGDHSGGTLLPIAVVLACIFVPRALIRLQPQWFRTAPLDLFMPLAFVLYVFAAGLSASLEPSIRAQRLASEALCRRQAALPPVVHSANHIDVAQAKAAFAHMPGLTLRLYDARDGATDWVVLIPPGHYRAGDLIVYRSASDASAALAFTPLAERAADTLPGLLHVKRVLNVLFEYADTISATERCTLLARLARLE